MREKWFDGKPEFSFHDFFVKCFFANMLPVVPVLPLGCLWCTCGACGAALVSVMKYIYIYIYNLFFTQKNYKVV